LFNNILIDPEAPVLVIGTASIDAVGRLQDNLQTGTSNPAFIRTTLSATVLFALLNDIPPDEAVRLGVSAATPSLRHPGAVNPELSLAKIYDQLII
jgi:hypothetical protein